MVRLRFTIAEKRLALEPSRVRFFSACVFLSTIGLGCSATVETASTIATHAPTASDATLAKARPNAAIHVFPPVFVDQTSRTTCKIPVTNDSDHPIRFTELTASCGCAETTLEPKALLPGETAQLTLVVHMEGHVGERRVSCMLRSDDGDRREYQASVTGYRRLQLAAPAFTFASVIPGKEAAGEILVTTHAPSGNLPPRLHSVTCAHPDLRCRFGDEQIYTDDNQVVVRTTRLKLHLAPQSITGRVSSQATIHALDGDERLTAILPIAWSLDSLLVLEPKRLFFRPTKHDKTLKRTLRLRRSDGGSLRLLATRCAQSAVHVEADDLPGKELLITVCIDPQQLPSDVFTDHLDLETDVEEEPIVRVPVTVLRPRS